MQRYLVRSQWSIGHRDGIGQVNQPSCLIKGVMSWVEHGQSPPIIGTEVIGIVTCEPSLIPAIEMTGSVILQELP